MIGMTKFFRVSIRILLHVMGVLLCFLVYAESYSGMQPQGYVMAWWDIPVLVLFVAAFVAVISVMCARNYFIKKYEEDEDDYE